MTVVSVIVCTYNRARLLPELLRRLAEETAGFSAEILLVDNASTDGTAEVVAAHEGVRYVLEMRQGLSHARNRGFDESGGDIVAYIDDDALPGDGWLRAHVGAYDDALVGAAGGPITLRLPEGMPRPGWLSRPFDRTLGAHDFGTVKRDYEGVAVPPGGNMSFRREAHAQAGPFDPALGRVGASLRDGEEFEVLHRLRAQGWRAVYLPDATVEHLIPPERVRLRYFRARLGDAYGSSELLAERGHGDVAFRSQLRHLAANIAVDSARLLRRDRAYHLVRVESHVHALARLLVKRVRSPRARR